GEPRGVGWSPDGAWVVPGTRTGGGGVSRFPSGERLHRLEHPGPITCLAFHPGGHLLALASDRVRVWDCYMAAFATPELPHPGVVVQLTFDRVGTRLATACADQKARVFHVAGSAEEPGPLFDPVVNQVIPGGHPLDFPPPQFI